MSVYLCYRLEGDGAVPAFDSVEAGDPAEALSWARGLLQRWPEWQAVEVWDGERRISTLTRAGD
jgi:hypothetical protein